MALGRRGIRHLDGGRCVIGLGAVDDDRGLRTTTRASRHGQGDGRGGQRHGGGGDVGVGALQDDGDIGVGGAALVDDGDLEGVGVGSGIGRRDLGERGLDRRGDDRLDDGGGDGLEHLGLRGDLGVDRGGLRRHLRGGVRVVDRRRGELAARIVALRGVTHREAAHLGAGQPGSGFGGGNSEGATRPPSMGRLSRKGF